MAYFRTLRNIELSAIYFIDTQITANWSGITVVKSFLSAYDSDVPVISVEVGNIGTNKLEVGANTLYHEVELEINIFAKSDGQRIDLTDFIIETLKDGFTYYIHSHPVGDNTTLTRVSTGQVRVVRYVENLPIDPGESTDIHDKYRQLILVVLRKT